MTRSLVLPRFGNRLLAWSALAAISFLSSAEAQTPTGDDSVARQKEVRASAEKIARDIAAIRTALAESGATAAQLADVDAILKQLGGLTQDDMQAVVAALAQAVAPGDGSVRRDGLLKAYEGQQGILSKVALLVAGIENRQNLQRLQLQLRDLLLRQGSNLRLTAALQNPDPNPPAKGKGTDPKVQGRLAFTNQQRIGENVLTVLASLDKYLAQIPPAEADPLRQAIPAGVGDKLRTDSAKAARSVQTATWADAAAAELAVRDSLFALASVLAPGDTAAALQKARDDLDALIEAQRQLNGDARPLAARSLAQGDLEDLAFVVEKSLASLNAEAAKQTGLAGGAMDRSRAALDAGIVSDAAGAGKDALATLTQARQLLQIQSDKLAAADLTASPDQRLAALTELQQATAQAIQQQDQIAQGAAAGQNTAAAAAELAKKVSDLQQKALPLAPEAAKAMGQAANSLATPPGTPPQNGQNSPNAQTAQNGQQNAPNNAPNNATAQSASNAANAANPANVAAQKLAAAAAELQKQIDQTKAEAAATAALASAQATLNQAQQNADQAKNALQSGQPGQAVAPLSTASQALQNLPPQAGQAVQDAKKALDQALDQAGHGNAQAAQASTQQAQAALGQAQKALSQAMQAMAQHSQAAMAQNAGLTPSEGIPGAPTPGQPSGSSGSGGGAYGAATNTLAGSGADAAQNSALALGALHPKERQAIAEMQREKVSPEYAAPVSQYYKNLATGAGGNP